LGSAFGDDSGHFIQAVQTTRFFNVTLSSSSAVERLAGVEGHDPAMDHRLHPRPNNPPHPQKTQKINIFKVRIFINQGEVPVFAVDEKKFAFAKIKFELIFFRFFGSF